MVVSSGKLVCHSAPKYLRFWLPPVLVLAAFAPADSQAPPAGSSGQSPTIKSEVRVVLVDVVVTQKKGQPASALRREDFQIFEDGRHQTISFFEEHKTTEVTQAQSAPPPGVYTNAQTANSSDAVNILLLDWLNTQPQDRAYAQAQIAQYLRRAPAGRSFAAFVLGSHLRMVEGFTSNSALLLAALNPQSSGAAQSAAPLLASGVQDAAERQMVDTMMLMQTAPTGIDAVRDEQSQTNAANTSKRVNITLQAMQELSRYLAGLPGRKNVIWFSSAFPINLFPNGDIPHQYAQQLKRVTDSLAESRVSIYPVSTTGLSQDFSSALKGQSQMQGPGGGDITGSGIANQLAMETLAKGTGGKAFYNTNALGNALAQAVEEGSHYYTITYSPLNGKMDGKFRKIEVKVQHRGYKVACRQGYYATDAGSGASPEEHLSGTTLAGLVRVGMPDVSQIPYAVRVTTANLSPVPDADANLFGAKTPVRRYQFHFSVPLGGLNIETSPDGLYRDSLSILIAAYDFTGKLRNLSTREFDIALDLADYGRARQEGLLLYSEIDAPHGDLNLRTGIRELNSSAVGTLGIAMSESAALAAMGPSAADSSASEHAEALPEKPYPSLPKAPAEIHSVAPAPKSPPVWLDPGDPSNAPVAGPPCRIQDVLPKVAMHVKELVEGMNEFTATESLLRERLDRDGKPRLMSHSRSDYVVTIQNLGAGNYTVSEYRHVTEGVRNLEGGLSSDGTPALAMIFHPTHLEEFDMTCGNLVDLHGQDTWEIHFRQRMDRPATIGTFGDGHEQYALLLSGTAWINSSNYQLVHLDADIIQPIAEAKLNLLHQSVAYSAVSFAGHQKTLWLPKTAVVTVEFGGQLLREHRSYSDFQLFAVDTGQKINAPKQPPQ